MNEPWEIKYKPSKWQDLILPQNPVMRKLLVRLLTTGYFPKAGILLAGPGGEGKTTFANMLSTTTGWSTIELKESGEGKDKIQELHSTLKLIPWSDNRSVYGDKWLVIGNEISQSSVKFRDGLRGLIDAYHSNSFFVFTDNDPDKLYDQNPQVFADERIKRVAWDDLDKNEMLAYCTKVLELEGIPDSRQRQIILSSTMAAAGKSIRKALSELEINTYGLK